MRLEKAVWFLTWNLVGLVLFGGLWLLVTTVMGGEAVVVEESYREERSYGGVGISSNVRYPGHHTVDGVVMGEDGQIWRYTISQAASLDWASADIPLHDPVIAPLYFPPQVADLEPHWDYEGIGDWSNQWLYQPALYDVWDLPEPIFPTIPDIPVLVPSFDFSFDFGGIG